MNNRYIRKDEADKNFLKTIDEINRKLGKSKIQFGTSLQSEKKDWKMKSEFISPRFTTVWEEILKIDLSKVYVYS